MSSLLHLFWTFFKIGLFTFGGGYAMIPMIVDETRQFGILSENDIVDFIAISESTPGPFAINIATFIGYSQNGILGAIFTTLGVVLPSFIIILLLANIIERVKDNRYFKSIIKTVMPLVIGLILSTVIDISLTSLFSIENLNNIKNEFSLNSTTLISLILISLFTIGFKIWKNKKPAPILTIVICAGLGIIISCLLV
jgi:chromate transporter